jgi:glucose-1-phosphate thymidylyltransferase
MIFYPVQTLINSGINDILVVSTPEDTGRYMQLLEEEFSANFTYRVQKEPHGIAHALQLAEDFVNDTVAVILGDNVILEDLSDKFDSFESKDEEARIFVKHVDKPSRYGIANINDEAQIADLSEKPSNPEGNNAVIGLYLYTKSVFDEIEQISKSDRGEYEITDVNRRYLEQSELGHSFVDGEWFDVGTPDGLLEASKFIESQ